jgi:hypothetical protein
VQTTVHREDRRMRQTEGRATAQQGRAVESQRVIKGKEPKPSEGRGVQAGSERLVPKLQRAHKNAGQTQPPVILKNPMI